MTREEQNQAKRDFIKEWSSFEAKIPEDFLVLLISKPAMKGVKPNRIINTRYARTYDTDILAELKKITPRVAK